MNDKTGSLLYTPSDEFTYEMSSSSDDEESNYYLREEFEKQVINNQQQCEDTYGPNLFDKNSKTTSVRCDFCKEYIAPYNIIKCKKQVKKDRKNFNNRKLFTSENSSSEETGSSESDDSDDDSCYKIYCSSEHRKLDWEQNHKSECYQDLDKRTLDIELDMTDAIEEEKKFKIDVEFKQKKLGVNLHISLPDSGSDNSDIEEDDTQSLIDEVCRLLEELSKGSMTAKSLAYVLFQFTKYPD